MQHGVIRFDQRLQPRNRSGAVWHVFALPLLIGALFVPVQAAAQDAAGGLRLTFGVALRAESESNADLEVVSTGRTTRTVADLSFGLTSETRSSRIALAAGVALQAESGAARSNNGVVNPFATLSFGHQSADAALTLDAALRQTDLATQSDVTDFDGTTGTRRLAALDLGLQLGTNAPLGFGLSAGATDTTYQDAPGESDTRSLRVGATARLNLSQVATLTFGLRGQRFDEDGVPQSRDTLGFDAGLVIDRPRGTFGLNLAVDDTEDGQRETLRLSNSLELPGGALSYSVGATVGVDNTARLTGSLDYSLALPRGSLTASLDRSLRAGSDDRETEVTSAALGYQQELTPTARFGLSLNWAESTATGTGTATTNATFGATYSLDLTEDWALDLGYTRRLRDEDLVGRAESDRIFLGLRREFTALR